jgi:hypothetical protein
MKRDRSETGELVAITAAFAVTVLCAVFILTVPSSFSVTPLTTV